MTPSVCLYIPSYHRQFRAYGVDILQACPGVHREGSYIKTYSLEVGDITKEPIWTFDVNYVIIGVVRTYVQLLATLCVFSTIVPSYVIKRSLLFIRIKLSLP